MRIHSLTENKRGYGKKPGEGWPLLKSPQSCSLSYGPGDWSYFQVSGGTWRHNWISEWRWIERQEFTKWQWTGNQLYVQVGKLLSKDREEDRRPLNRQESKEKSRTEWKDLSSRWRQRIGTDRAMRGPCDTLESLWLFVCFKLPHAYVKSFISVTEENVVFWHYGCTIPTLNVLLVPT